MLFIVDETFGSGPGASEFEWHINEPLPRFENIAHVNMIQADGDELALIAEMYPALTAQGKRVVRFDGCIARTILRNLG